ncbi:hypothetical protein V2G26_014905 [Clonostachys chloroleuca]
MSSSILANDLFNVKGLVAFVTGGGSGIGLLIAQALEANGAIVYIYGRRKEVLEKAAQTAKHGNIHIKTAHGYVNLVIANAGIGGPSIKTLKPNASLEEFENHLWGWTAEEFTETFAANTTGAFNTVAAFLQLLGEGNKKGNVTQKSQVIATSSIGAFNRSLTQGYAYGGSKAAVVHIFKQLATTLVPYDIRSNIIAPGFYPSEMTATVIAEREKQGWPKSIIPEQRAGDAQDIAGAVLFLVSRAGAYINGNVLITDGGRLSVVPATY